MRTVLYYSNWLVQCGQLENLKFIRITLTFSPVFTSPLAEWELSATVPRPKIVAMPSLADLPLELLVEIGTVNSQLMFDTSKPSDQRHSAKIALVRLIQTCKYFCAVFQPILYEIIPRQTYCVPLVRTLVESPELASMVKQFNVGNGWTCVVNLSQGEGTKPNKKRKWSISPMEASIFNTVAKKYNFSRSITEERQGNDHFHSIPAGDERAWGNGEAGSDGLISRLISIAILQCRFATDIAIYPNSRDSTAVENIDFSFNQLREVCIDHIGFLERPGETRGFFQPNTGLGWLFKAAPNLESFYGCEMGRIDGGIRGDNLLSLQLDNSYLRTADVDILFDNSTNWFPKLEHFSFKSNGSNSQPIATPKHLLGGLARHHSKTIKSIAVIWSNRRGFSKPSWRDDDFAHSLDMFENLERAVVEVGAFNANEDDVCIGLFKRIFPPSTQYIGLGLLMESKGVTRQCLQEIVDDEHFSDLREINASAIRLDPPEDGVRAGAVEKRGI